MPALRSTIRKASVGMCMYRVKGSSKKKVPRRVE